MVMWKFYVKKDERALLFERGDFVEILRPGEYWRFDPLRRLSVEKFALAQPRFEHRLADFLVKEAPEVVAREFYAVQLGPTEVGLRYENGVLAEVLAPSTRRLYWKGYIDLAFERIDISTDFTVDAKLVPQLITLTASGFKAKVTGADVYGVQVPQFNAAVVYVDGKLGYLLDPGLRAFWRFGRDLRVEFVDLRLQVLEVAGQEILTKDKVPLRVNLTAGYRVADVLTAFGKQAKPADYLYKELQFGLRAAVGTRTLDELLENKGLIDQVVAEHIERRVQGFGLEVDSVGVKDIILPGEMKALLAKVVEALEKVTEKIDKISVFGGLDAVLKDLVKIR
jgi:hypothetical protein